MSSVLGKEEPKLYNKLDLKLLTVQETQGMTCLWAKDLKHLNCMELKFLGLQDQLVRWSMLNATSLSHWYETSHLMNSSKTSLSYLVILQLAMWRYTKFLLNPHIRYASRSTNTGFKGLNTQILKFFLNHVPVSMNWCKQRSTFNRNSYAFCSF